MPGPAVTSTGPAGAGRALVTGWFSFDEVIATIGDELGCEAATEWLAEAGWQVDVAYAPYLRRGVYWRDVDPAGYDLLVFTTGPLSREPLLLELLDRFAAVPAWALNVSVVDAGVAARFTRVWPRDDAAAGIAVPDLAIAAPMPRQPVLAVAYAPAQAEYQGGRQIDVAGALRDWLETRKHAFVELDTDLYAAHRWPRSPGQVSALIGRCDAVVTMRLHGLVLALAAGVPAVAVDAVPGGAKVSHQARALGWPHLVTADDVDPDRLDELLARCLTPEARTLAARCRDRAVEAVAARKHDVVAAAEHVARTPAGR